MIRNLGNSIFMSLNASYYLAGGIKYCTTRFTFSHLRRTSFALVANVIFALSGQLVMAAPPTTEGWTSSECIGIDEPCSPSSPTNRKFVPGFYAGLGRNAGTPVDVSAIAGRDEYVGIVRIYNWKDLEPTFGNFDFSRIDDDKAVTVAHSRKLGIYFRMARVTAGGNPVTPSYMWNDPSYGGVIAGAYGKTRGA